MPPLSKDSIIPLVSEGVGVGIQLTLHSHLRGDYWDIGHERTIQIAVAHTIWTKYRDVPDFQISIEMPVTEIVSINDKSLRNGSVDLYVSDSSAAFAIEFKKYDTFGNLIRDVERLSEMVMICENLTGLIVNPVLFDSSKPYDPRAWSGDVLSRLRNAVNKPVRFSEENGPSHTNTITQASGRDTFFARVVSMERD